MLGAIFPLQWLRIWKRPHKEMLRGLTDHGYETLTNWDDPPSVFFVERVPPLASMNSSKPILYGPLLKTQRNSQQTNPTSINSQTNSLPIQTNQLQNKQWLSNSQKHQKPKK